MLYKSLIATANYEQIPMIKKDLRLHLKEKRRGIATGLYAEKCKRIGEQLRHLQEYKDAQRVLFYVSTTEEVDTHELIKEALNSGENVYLPKTINDALVICTLYDFE